MNDNHQSAKATPDGCKAAAVDTSSPLPVTAAAAIPEVGMCGFDFASYDRLNREYWGERNDDL